MILSISYALGLSHEVPISQYILCIAIDLLNLHLLVNHFPPPHTQADINAYI